MPFSSETCVKLSDGNWTQVSNIKQGDKLWAEEESTVLQVICINGHQEVIDVSKNVILTPEQLVFIQDEWVFADEYSFEIDYTNCVYNFILDKNHIITVGTPEYELESCTIGYCQDDYEDVIMKVLLEVGINNE